VDSITSIETTRAGDAAIVAAARAGDRSALERLLRLHHDRLYAVCRRVTGDDGDAADATQEAMIAVVRGLAAFDGRSSFSTWSHRVAVNASLDELRRRRRRPVPILDASPAEPDHPLGGQGGDPAAAVAERLQVEGALARLPTDYRVAVVLRDLSGLSYSEIADVLGIPVGTVRSRIARGRGVLAGLLAPDDALPQDATGGGR
jgi:RNA polymerase sigma-70 factor (ECF subfamily)